MRTFEPLESNSRPLKLSKQDRSIVFETLKNYLHDKSGKVRLFSMQALANLAIDEVDLRPQVIALLNEVTKTGSPAMKTQGRKLLAWLKKYSAA